MPRLSTLAQLIELARERHVEVLGECWQWTGVRHRHGYGKTGLNRKTLLAHRAFYEHYIGPIPDGYHVDHRCKNRACVNPAHLEAVTPKENNARSESPSARNARRGECLKGHPLEGANLYMTPDGRRQCRSCGAERDARARVKRRMEVACA